LKQAVLQLIFISLLGQLHTVGVPVNICSKFSNVTSWNEKKNSFIFEILMLYSDKFPWHCQLNPVSPIPTTSNIVDYLVIKLERM
jgi:hypothetical protein